MLKIAIDARNLVTGLSGISRYVLEMSNGLSQRGCDVTLFLPSPAHSAVKLPTSLKSHIDNFPGPGRRLLWSQTKLPRNIAKGHFDIFWGPAHRIAPRLPTHVTKVLTIHDLVWKKAPETMRYRTWLGELMFMQASLKRAHHVVASSYATQKALSETFPKLQKPITMVYPGLTWLPNATQSSLSTLGLKPNFFLFVGTLEPRKNLVRTLKAYLSLPKPDQAKHPMIIVGAKGWGSNPSFRQLLQAENVQTLGHVDDVSLSALYDNCKALLMPSLYEGFGFPILEALSRGKPVITSTNSSMPEVGGPHALYVDPLNEAEIHRAMQDVIRGDLPTGFSSQEARHHASHFTWERASQELLSVFEQTLKGNTNR